jgi:GTP-binding protein YchF
MGFRCGIAGLPNVGKSTLFNALTATQAAQASNYPFCTIDPNIGRVAIPDERLGRIAALAGSAKTIPTQLEFVDIAGLVRGASKGEGLGNRFLGNIREVDAIAHVVRCFETADIVHVEGHVDPIRDIETIETELMLADLESLERRWEAAEKRAKTGDKDAQALLRLIDPALSALRAGTAVRNAPVDPGQRRELARLHLLTSKPVLYIANVEESAAATGNEYSEAVEMRASAEGAEWVVISAAIEAEIAQLSDPDEKAAFLETLGLEEPGLNRVIRAGYRLLGLITFFTAGPKEARAWTVPTGTRAAQAAGAIHTDFERGFIRAETITYDDFIAYGGEQAVKDAGRMRQEGRDYLVQDGDVMLFRFNT